MWLTCLGLIGLAWAVSAQTVRYRIEADLEGVLFLLKGAGAELRWTGEVPFREIRGDTLVLRFAAYRSAPLGMLGMVADTITLRVPEGAPVDLHLNLRKSWADLDLTGLQVGRIRGKVSQGKLSLRWKGESTCGPIELHAGLGTLELSGLGWSFPPFVVITASLARVRLNLFQPPRKKVPIVITGNFLELRLRAGGVPLILRREGIFQFGKEAHRPGKGFDVLFSGAFGRLVWEP